jgi:dihydroorotase
MGKSIGDLFFNSLEKLETAIAKYSGQSVSFHCEDPEILMANEKQLSHEARRPSQAEVSAVDFALRLIEKYRLRGKICHCSTQKGLVKVVEAKSRGVNVTVEVSPHHLFYDASMITTDNHRFLQMNPPVRTAADRLELIAALKDGRIDYLATDHAPHTLAEKQAGTSGTPQLDTYGPFATWLIKEHQFAPADIARVCSQNPGQWFGQFSPTRYGKIEPGYAGSLTVLNPSRPVKIEKSMLKTKCAWSPFEGITFPGSVAMTVVKGKVFKPDHPD